MTNYFSSGIRASGYPPRFPFTPSAVNNSEYPDVSSLSISLANACLSPSSNSCDPLQRFTQARSFGSMMSGNNQFSQSSNASSNSWLDRSSILSHLAETGASLNSTALEGKLHGTPQDELIKTAFLANRLSGRGNNSDLLIDMKPNAIPNRHFSGSRPVLDADGFNPLSTVSSSESKAHDHLNHFPPISSRHLTSDEGVGIGFPGDNSSNLAMPSFYPLSDDTHPKTSVSDNFAANTWLVNPPAPIDSGAHLRTGRAHEIKAKVVPERALTTSYMDQALRQDLHNKLKASLVTPSENSKFPTTLGAYDTVTPIEASSNPRVSDVLGFPTQCFRAWSPRLAAPVLLRRVVLPKSAPPLPNEAYYLAKQLCDLEHPSVVHLRDVFPTNDFSDNSLIFVYDYWPCSTTLQQLHMGGSPKSSNLHHFAPSNNSNEHPKVDLLPEKTAWMYLVQLTQALRFTHKQANRSIGILHPSKILVQDRNRLLINCFGLRDILTHNPAVDTVAQEKLADFVALGKLMLGVICGTTSVIQRPSAIQLISQVYKKDLANLINDLLTGTVTSVDTLTMLTAPYAYDHMATLYSSNDFLEQQLLREMECERLFRLICKLNSVVERNDVKRPDRSAPAWSETGDRYMLKLFRDFVFHQVDQCGAAHLDLAHIVNALNKVESASPEKLCLVSRDGQRVIIASFAEEEPVRTTNGSATPTGPKRCRRGGADCGCDDSSWASPRGRDLTDLSHCQRSQRGCLRHWVASTGEGGGLRIHECVPLY
ncbi:PAB-dependent poly(A)-specific ribonuclease subunit 3 [Sparganum proliferum]